MNVSDGTLRFMIETGEIGLDPYSPQLVQPASIDVRLAESFLRFDQSPHDRRSIDTRHPELDEGRRVTIPDGEPFILGAGEFALGATIEKVKLPPGIVAQINGKSSLGRMGLLVHATAGFIDPGFEGTLTLELANLRRRPMLLWPGMRIAQLAYTMLDRAADRPYGHPDLGSHYQGQIEVTGSRT